MMALRPLPWKMWIAKAKKRKYTAEYQYWLSPFCLGSHIVFLLFRLCETKPEWRWQLTASGRFAHRKEYVESIAANVGLEVIYNEVMDGFRQEHGKAVRGNMFIVKKATKNDEL